MRTLVLALSLSLLAVPSSALAVSSKRTKKKVVHKKHHWVRRVLAHFAPVPVRVRQAAFTEVSGRMEERTAGFENPAALVPLFERLYRLQQNPGPLHILHYGDSHTASDDWANTLRTSLQAKFGVGGPGFLQPGHPFRGYRRFDAKSSSSSGWLTEGLAGHPGDGRYGLGGFSLTAHAPRQTLTLTTECDQLELHYLRQPGGGEVELQVDRVPVTIVSTDGEAGVSIYTYAPLPGPHEYTLETRSSDPVRLLGWVAQNNGGVTYEELGINGARASIILDWDAATVDAQIAGRDPALIVVAYGTNEAIQRGWTEAEFRTGFRDVLRRLRRAAPAASILVVGPPDCSFRLHRHWMPLPNLKSVVAIERDVALAEGCAFWDWRANMGGPGSVVRWVEAGLSQSDHIHLTSAGYRLLGSAMYGALMQQYSEFLSVRTEAEAAGGK